MALAAAHADGCAPAGKTGATATTIRRHAGHDLLPVGWDDHDRAGRVVSDLVRDRAEQQRRETASAASIGESSTPTTIPGISPPQDAASYFSHDTKRADRRRTRRRRPARRAVRGHAGRSG